ncbi:SCO4402 family protein [Streptomyces termitum]|uniref:SCO4402 family protein n=1 Tax=Streptomyces termitum TaxID=67368 RepID=UPI0033A39FCF
MSPHRTDPVEFPDVRTQVLWSLRSLSDVHHQERVWRNGAREAGDAVDDLTSVVHVLFDDTRVLEDPENRVGWVLASDREVRALQALAALLDPLIDRLGDAADAVYLDAPEWPGVVEAAQRAFGTMTGRDPSA